MVEREESHSNSKGKLFMSCNSGKGDLYETFA